jgi:hypothetical protein
MLVINAQFCQPLFLMARMPWRHWRAVWLDRRMRVDGRRYDRTGAPAMSRVPIADQIAQEYRGNEKYAFDLSLVIS